MNQNSRDALTNVSFCKKNLQSKTTLVTNTTRNVFDECALGLGLAAKIRNDYGDPFVPIHYSTAVRSMNEPREKIMNRAEKPSFEKLRKEMNDNQSDYLQSRQSTFNNPCIPESTIRAQPNLFRQPCSQPLFMTESFSGQGNRSILRRNIENNHPHLKDYFPIVKKSVSLSRQEDFSHSQMCNSNSFENVHNVTNPAFNLEVCEGSHERRGKKGQLQTFRVLENDFDQDIQVYKTSMAHRNMFKSSTKKAKKIKGESNEWGSRLYPRLSNLAYQKPRNPCPDSSSCSSPSPSSIVNPTFATAMRPATHYSAAGSSQPLREKEHFFQTQQSFVPHFQTTGPWYKASSSSQPEQHFWQDGQNSPSKTFPSQVFKPVPIDRDSPNILTRDRFSYDDGNGDGDVENPEMFNFSQSYEVHTMSPSPPLSGNILPFC